MKKFLLLIIVLALISGFFYYKNSRSENLKINTPAGTNFKPDPSSATFDFDDLGKVTLSNGQSDTEDETGVNTETLLLQQRGSGDLNNDNKGDTVVLLAQSGGGSGVFIYLAAYVSGPVSYKGSNAVFVGDRISPQSVSVSNGIITFKYLDRKPDEPFAAEPTVPTTKQYVYKNGLIEER